VRLTRIVPITLAVTLATAVVPAQAVGPFTHPQKALTADCFPALTVLDATGARHGFASCSTRFKDHLAFISAAPGAPWKVNRLRITGYVHAVADDGSSTYALYSKRHGTYVLKRTRGGAISHHRISKVPGGDGAIVARGGKWFAIWVGYPKVVDGTCPPLYSGGTLGHTRHGKATGFCGAYPSLALTSSGKPITAFQTGNYQLGNNIDLSTWRHRKWKKPAALARRGMLADISTSGATTNVVWLHVAQNSTLV
jgi:hypothetical protein